jgi:hypothetical protein
MMYGEKLMQAGCARALDEFHAIAAVFRGRIGGEQAPCLRNFVDVKSYFLSAECCTVTAHPDGMAGNERVSATIERNQTLPY